LANHKSALKRNRQSLIRRGRNRANKTKVKNVIKAVDAAIAENSIEKAQEALKVAIPVIQRAAVKGAYHQKTASRKVSRLTIRVNKFIKGTEEAAA
jgi:small subunit ribosomal protein S20